MRFKKHEVRYNDTMQAISQRYYGSPEYWIDLIEHNNLKYPYIVDDHMLKKDNPEHLVTTGDYIIIPEYSYLTNATLKEINKKDRDILVDMALGSDLNVTSNEDYFNKHGTSDEILNFTEDNKGDLSTVVGVDNIKQQLQTRLLTPKGSLILHPDYGSNIHELFDKNIPETAVLIELEIIRTLLSDSRVKNVNTIDWTLKGKYFWGKFSVEIESVEESIIFVLQSDETGIFARFE